MISVNRITQLIAVLLLASCTLLLAGEAHYAHELVVGTSYRLPKDAMLCPEVKPADPMDALKYMVTIPEGAIVKIEAIADSDGRVHKKTRPQYPWYSVSIVDAPLIGWKYLNGDTIDRPTVKRILNITGPSGWINSMAMSGLMVEVFQNIQSKGPDSQRRAAIAGRLDFSIEYEQNLQSAGFALTIALSGSDSTTMRMVGPMLDREFVEELIKVMAFREALQDNGFKSVRFFDGSYYSATWDIGSDECKHRGSLGN